MEGEPNPWDSVSDDAKTFIKSLLTVDPRERPSFDELLKNNKWLTGDMTEDQKAHLGGTTENIKKYQARKRLKGAIRKVITVNRIKKLNAPVQVSINETADKAVIAVTPREEEG